MPILTMKDFDAVLVHAHDRIAIEPGEPGDAYARRVRAFANIYVEHDDAQAIAFVQALASQESQPASESDNQPGLPVPQGEM